MRSNKRVHYGLTEKDAIAAGMRLQPAWLLCHDLFPSFPQAWIFNFADIK